MRVVQPLQMILGEVDIAQFVFDKRSRDDIPKVLCGLQHLYLNKPLRDALFALLEAELLPKINKTLGRPGMPLWNIFVCAVLRLDLNADYDRIHELANQHVTFAAEARPGRSTSTPTVTKASWTTSACSRLSCWTKSTR